MAGDFFERMDNLARQVGDGKIRSAVVVDQVYAKYQELRDDIGIRLEGQHHYLRDSLYAQLSEIRAAWARKLVTPGGSDVRGAGQDVAEIVAQGVYERAPLEFGDLKASPHPTAADNGAVYYDRAPMIHRLSDDELKAKGDLRRLGFGNSGMTDAVRDALGATP